MARENKTRYAVLGLLAMRPMSGYDIKQMTEQCLSHFWNESYGQIYPMLAKLTADGSVVKSVGAGDGKPDRHIYTITASGLAEVREWLDRPDEVFKVRHETILKVFFGDSSAPETTAARLLTLRESLTATLDEYRRIGGQIAAHDHPAGPDYGRYALRSGILTTSAFIAWCDETLKDLELYIET